MTLKNTNILDMLLDLIQQETIHTQTEDMVEMSLFSGADLSSYSPANNKTRSILILGEDSIQGIDGTTIYAEKM